jgi:hypothetical protein
VTAVPEIVRVKGHVPTDEAQGLGRRRASRRALARVSTVRAGDKPPRMVLLIDMLKGEFALPGSADSATPEDYSQRPR